MTTGDKIKYLRKQLGITQAQLAEMTGIHIVTIKKYETNKVQPLPAQIDKLSSALCVSSVALAGIDKTGLRIHTVGDLMGIVMALCNLGFFTLTGQRASDHMLIPESANLQINPILNTFIQVSTNAGAINISDFFIKIKSQSFFHDIIRWEHICFLYNKAVADAGSNPDPFTKAALEDINYKKEVIELEMQRSQILLKS